MKTLKRDKYLDKNIKQSFLFLLSNKKKKNNNKNSPLNNIKTKKFINFKNFIRNERNDKNNHTNEYLNSFSPNYIKSETNEENKFCTIIKKKKSLCMSDIKKGINIIQKNKELQIVEPLCLNQKIDNSTLYSSSFGKNLKKYNIKNDISNQNLHDNNVINKQQNWRGLNISSIYVGNLRPNEFGIVTFKNTKLNKSKCQLNKSLNEFKTIEIPNRNKSYLPGFGYTSFPKININNLVTYKLYENIGKTMSWILKKKVKDYSKKKIHLKQNLINNEIKQFNENNDFQEKNLKNNVKNIKNYHKPTIVYRNNSYKKHERNRRNYGEDKISMYTQTNFNIPKEELLLNYEQNLQKHRMQKTTYNFKKSGLIEFDKLVNIINIYKIKYNKNIKESLSEDNCLQYSEIKKIIESEDNDIILKPKNILQEKTTLSN